MKLVCGDAFKELRKWGGNTVDYSFTSPPYNRKRNDKYEFYCDVVDDFYKYLVTFTDELLRITSKHTFINVMANYYNKQDIYKFIGHYADKIQQTFIWEKSNPLPAQGKNITNSYEFVFCLGDKPLKSNFTYTKNHITTSVNTKTSKIHKAVMNIEVARFFIKHFTQTDDVIMDCFMGLGTTGIACKELGREFVGIEINPQYFEIAKNRIENEKSLFEKEI